MSLLFKVVEVEHVAVEVCEDVFLVEMLLAVQRELLTAHGTLPPVGLNMALETALLKVWRENDFTQRTALMNISPERQRETPCQYWIPGGGTDLPWLSKQLVLFSLLHYYSG